MTRGRRTVGGRRRGVHHRLKHPRYSVRHAVHRRRGYHIHKRKGYHLKRTRHYSVPRHVHRRSRATTGRLARRART